MVGALLYVLGPRVHVALVIKGNFCNLVLRIVCEPLVTQETSELDYILINEKLTLVLGVLDELGDHYLLVEHFLHMNLIRTRILDVVYAVHDHPLLSFHVLASENFGEKKVN